jgi:hypothetical protein
MLLSGINHVALLTGDTDRLVTFYREVFEATSTTLQASADHLALQAASLDSFDDVRSRLLERDATDGFVTDFGHMLSLFFRDPDGLECEVCVPNPDAQPGMHNPPGTPSSRYHPDGTPPPSRVRDRRLPGQGTRGGATPRGRCTLPGTPRRLR